MPKKYLIKVDGLTIDEKHWQKMEEQDFSPDVISNAIEETIRDFYSGIVGDFTVTCEEVKE